MISYKKLYIIIKYYKKEGNKSEVYDKSPLRDFV